MKQENTFRPSLEEVLSKHASTAQILGDEQTFSHLVQEVQSERSLIPLEKMLLEELCISWQDMLKVFEEMRSSSRCWETFGNLLLQIEVCHHLYGELTLNSKKVEERKAVQKHIHSYMQKQCTLDQAFVNMATSIQDIEDPQTREEMKQSILQMEKIQQFEACVGVMTAEAKLEANFEHSEQATEKIIQDIPVEPITEEERLKHQKEISEEENVLLQDLQSFDPQSIEYFIQNELIKTFRKVHQLPNQDEVNLDKIKKYLNQQKQFEEYKELLSKIEAGSSKQKYELMKNLKSKLMIIDVPELGRLVKKALQAKDEIKDKDIIFTIGMTGSGKSTNLLRFLGYQVKWVLTSTGLRNLTCTDVHPDHVSLKAGAETKSCTRYIFAAKIPESMFSKLLRQKDKNLMICDTPGFGDTAGIEVDIANCIGMMSALFGCKSVRILVIMSQDSLTHNRFSGILEIGRIVTKLFYNFADVAQSVQCYFNKFKKEDIEEFQAKIKDKDKNLQSEEPDQNLKVFSKLLVVKSEEEQNFVNPLNGDYMKLLQKIRKMNKIENIREKMKYNFAEETKKNIQNYCQNSEIKIKNYFEAIKYNLAAFYLKLLHQLTIIINEEYMHKTVERIKNQIKRTLSNELIELQNLLNQTLEEAASSKQFERVKNSIQKIELLSNKFAQFQLGSQVDRIKEITDSYRSKIETVLENPKEEEKIKMILINSKVMSQFDPSILTTISKILMSKYLKSFEILQKQLTKENIFERKEFLKAFAEAYTFYNQSITMLAKDNDKIREEKEKNAEKIKDSIDKIEKNVKQILNWISTSILNKKYFSIDKQKMQDFKKNYETLKTYEVLNILSSQLNLSQNIKNIRSECQAKCLIILEKLETFSPSKRKVENQQIQQLKDFKLFLESAQKILSLPEEFGFKYENAKNTIKNNLRMGVISISKQIKLFKQNKIENLEETIENISESLWYIDECAKIFETEDSSKLKDDFVRQFTKYLQKEKKVIEEVDDIIISKRMQTSNIEEIAVVYKKLQQFEKLSGILPEIQQILQEIKNILVNKIVQPLQKNKNIVNKTDRVNLRIHLERFQSIAYYFDILSSYAIKFDKDKTFSSNKFWKQLKNNFNILLNDIKTEIDNYCQETSSKKEIDQLSLNDLGTSIIALLDQDESENSDSISKAVPESLDFMESLELLVHINKMTYLSKFVFSYIHFVIEDEVAALRPKLQKEKIILETEYEKIKGGNQQKQLQKCSKKCNLYKKMSKLLGYDNEARTNFQEIDKSIQDDFFRVHAEEKQFLEGLSKTSIFELDYPSIYDIYQANNNNKTAKSVRKIKMIMSFFQNKQKELNKKLIQVRLEDDQEFTENVFNIYIEVVNQLYFLRQNLIIFGKNNKIILVEEKYIEAEMKNIQNIVTWKFEQIFSCLQNIVQNQRKFQKDIDIFNKIESKIIEFIHHNRQNNELTALFQRLFKNFEQKLKEQITKYISYEEIQTERNITTLCKKYKEVQINKMTQTYAERKDFVLDNTFGQYYAYIEKDEKKRKDIQQKLEERIDNKISKFKKVYDKEFQRKEQIERDIQQDLKILMSQKIPIHSKLRQKFEDAEKSLKQQIQIRIKDGIEKIKTNVNFMNEYLEEIKKATQNKQEIIADQYREQFLTMYSEIESSNIEEAQQFILQSNFWFKQVLHKNLQPLEETGLLKTFLEIFTTNIQKIQTKVVPLISQITKIFMESNNESEKQTTNQMNSIFQYVNYLQSYNEEQRKLVKSLEGALHMIKVKFESLWTIINEKISIIIEVPTIMSEQTAKKQKQIRQALQYLQKRTQLLIELQKHITTIKSQQENTLFNQKLFEKPFNEIEYQTSKERFENELFSLIQSVGNFEFFDFLKKNLNAKGLERQYQDLKHNLQILKNTQNLYNTCFCKNTNSKLDINQVQSSLNTKFKKFQQDVMKQTKEIFEDINYSSENKITLYNNTVQLFKMKKYRFIHDLIGAIERKKELENVVQNLFYEKRRNCDEKMKEVKTTFHNYNKEIQKEKNIFKIRKGEIADQKNKECEEKKKVQNDKTEKDLQDAADEKAKEALKKQLNCQLQSIQAQFENSLKAALDKLTKQYEEKQAKLKDNLDTSIEQFLDNIVHYQKAMSQVIYYNEYETKKFTEILNKLTPIKTNQDEKHNNKLVDMIISKVQAAEGAKQQLGQRIVQDYQIFESFKKKQRKLLMESQDIHYVMQHVKRLNKQSGNFASFNKQQIEDILTMYRWYHEDYLKNIQYFKKQDVPVGEEFSFLTQNIQSLVTDIKNKQSDINKAQKCELIAKIASLWACQKAQKDDDDNWEFQVELHPTQVTTLFALIFGISGQNQQKKDKLDNRFAQVGTGEGKSVILAFLSCYLALNDYQVSCACYSAYLSDRDQASFASLFSILNIQHKIKYGTFNELCKSILNSSDDGSCETIQQKTKKIITAPKEEKGIWSSLFEKVSIFGSKEKKKDNKNKTKRIMIIDELDVFFQSNFFGMTYDPSVSLTGQNIQKLLKYVWQQTKNNQVNTDANKIEKSAQFQAVLGQFPCLNELLINQVHGMIDGALAYKHDYHIHDKKIMYRDSDTYTDKISYGYKTVFAYLYEYEQGKISQINLHNALKISLRVAQFSYAALPSYYDCILGVTGTLEVIPNFKKVLLRDRYKVSQQFLIPSAFGVNKRRKQNYHIIPSEQYYEKIIECMKNVNPERPIIIFFNSIDELTDFFQSQIYSQKGDKNAVFLNELHDSHTRKQRIDKATCSGMRTLMTDSFGRGTDFIVLDSKLNQKGGVHVIQTFLSLDESEEVQIKGRTARQKNQGSYDAIICQGTLEKLQTTTIQVQNKVSQANEEKKSEAIHAFLKQKRSQKAEAEYKDTKILLKDADEKHKKTTEAYNPKNINQQNIVKFVKDLNLFLERSVTHIHTILAIDATGSMGAVLKKTCSICSQAFQRTYEVLKEKNTPGTFDVKVMVYRNYNAPHDKLLQYTAFESVPNNLKTFLDKVQAVYGWGAEAIQVALQAINKESELDQVILIGDAEANPQRQTRLKRQGTNISKGDAYWNSHNFPFTTFEKELEQFKAKNIPIHSFYLAAELFFREVSKQTKGQCDSFNVNDPQASEKLTEFIVCQILRMIGNKGGNKNGDALVEAYRGRYPVRRMYA